MLSCFLRSHKNIYGKQNMASTINELALNACMLTNHFKLFKCLFVIEVGVHLSKDASAIMALTHGILAAMMFHNNNNYVLGVVLFKN